MPDSSLRKLTSLVEIWFRKHQRALPWRAAYDPYMVWVSEVMLQQTRMEVVLRYYDRFIEHFPSIASLAASREEEVLAAWSGLGYYRRARMLREGAIDVMKRFGGTLPRTVEELRTISGIGRYTAGAICSIAYNGRAPIVDGNIARITSRLFAVDEPAGSSALMRAAWIRSHELVESCSTPRQFNQGLMEIGALICRPSKPECSECPLTENCMAFKSSRVEDFPRKRLERQTTPMVIPLYIINDGSGRLLMRRESGTLMTAMYHLPHGNTSLLDVAPLDASPTTLIGTFRHTITTRRIRFNLFSADLATAIRDGDEYAWIDPAQMTAVPHPSYVAKALELITRLQSLQCSGG